MSAEVKPDLLDELKAMWDKDIPCGGCLEPKIPPCGKSAMLKLMYFHNCPVPFTVQPEHFKCADCYTRYIVSAAETIAEFGGVSCAYCRGQFTRHEDFVRYGPL